MISFTQTIDENDLKHYLSVHYERLRTRKFLKVLSVMMIILGILIFSFGLYTYIMRRDNSLLMISVLYFAMSLILAFRKKISILKLVKISKTNKLFGTVMKVTITDDGAIDISQAENSSKIEITSLHSFLVTRDGIMLYLQKNLFYIFKKNSFPDKGLNEFVAILRNFKIKELD
jgi:hypothetical protein